MASGAEVKDLGVVDVKITGSVNFVGGLVGDNRGAVMRCYTNGAVFGTYGAGGLVGYNWAIVTHCYSTAAVSGDNNVGGLVGRTSGGSVAYCYSAGAVSGSGQAVGGLVGSNDGDSVTHCYSTGAVSGGEYVGGLVGSNWAIVTRCYSTGAVIGTSSVGGLVGSGEPDLVQNSFWDVETSGLNFSAAGVGLTTAEMMDPEILGLQGLGGDPNWILYSGRDYPRLVWEGTPGQIIPEPVIDWLVGNGTPEDPFQIENANQLLLLYKYSLFWCKHFVLNADIDLNPNLPGRSILGRAVIPAFEGSFVGNDHVILNLQIEGGDHLGLFGKLTKDSVVRDLGLENISVHGTGSNVGGLVGHNSGGHVLNCYSTGEVSGAERVGGLVGYNHGPVIDCYSTGAVSGDGCVGGLVGYNYKAQLTHCYSTGAVSGNDFVGGLVGVNYGYVTGCFWDTRTSDQITSAGGTGKKTAEMLLKSTFTIAGWDFIGEIENGGEDIWWILEGQDYPRLVREFSAFSSEPQDSATDVTLPIILRWRLGASAIYHDVYFGENADYVTNATTSSLGIYRGRLPVEITTYDPNTLELEKTYYWRIDEVNESDPNSPWKGNVWSFTTANFLIVDDFESYNDLDPYEPGSKRIFNTWIDGYDIPENGALVAYCDDVFWLPWSKAVHGGAQSMDLYYDNSGTANYSEATLTLTYPRDPRDWTEEGVGVLSLWFYGDPDNAPEQMYVAVANATGPTAVVYHDDTKATQITTWMEWRIDLQAFTDQDVDLTNINTISIGFGDKNNPQAGVGSGLVFFDDIRLYRPAEPEPEPEPKISGGFSKGRTIPDCGGNWSKSELEN